MKQTNDEIREKMLEMRFRLHPELRDKYEREREEKENQRKIDDAIEALEFVASLGKNAKAPRKEPASPVRDHFPTPEEQLADIEKRRQFAINEEYRRQQEAREQRRREARGEIEEPPDPRDQEPLPRSFFCVAPNTLDVWPGGECNKTQAELCYNGQYDRYGRTPGTTRTGGEMYLGEDRAAQHADRVYPRDRDFLFLTLEIER